MPAYIPITELETDPGAPGTSELWKKWRDNPIAIAEGATSAPRVQGIALGGISMGAVSVTGTGGQGWTDCDGMGLIYMPFVINAPSARTLRVRFSSNNGATYGARQNLISAGGSSGANSVSFGSLRLNLQTGVFYATQTYVQNDSAPAANAYGGGGTVTVPSNTNAFQFSWNLSGPTGSFDAYCLGGIE